MNLSSIGGHEERELIDVGEVIEVWPVGLGAMTWDGEGRAEWLADERPCLALCADHDLTSRAHRKNFSGRR